MAQSALLTTYNLGVFYNRFDLHFNSLRLLT